MRGTANPALQIVGDKRSPARKVILTRIASYNRWQGLGRMDFFEAHRKAEEKGGHLVSARAGLRLLHALSKPDSYSRGGEVEEPKGLLVPTPGLEMLLEGIRSSDFYSAHEIPGPFWCGALLVFSGRGAFGKEIVASPRGSQFTNIFHVPPELEKAGGIYLLYEPGTWIFERQGMETRYLPRRNARPVWIPEQSSGFDSSILDCGTDLPKEERQLSFRVTILSGGDSWVGPVLCTSSPNDSNTIRLSAILDPGQPMGAIMERPMD